VPQLPPLQAASSTACACVCCSTHAPPTSSWICTAALTPANTCSRCLRKPRSHPPPTPTPKQHHKPLTTTQMFTSLSSRLGCAAVLTADISGGNSFDEACSLPWHVLSRLYPNAGFNAETCASCTSEVSKIQYLHFSFYRGLRFFFVGIHTADLAALNTTRS
jgi:hypothetical protein